LEFNKRLEQIRKRLLDLSKRNKLINYRRPSKSRNLKIIDESPEFIYNYLVFEEKIFKFKSIPYPKMMPQYREYLQQKKVFETDKFLELEERERKLFYQFCWNINKPESLTLLTTNYITREHKALLRERKKLEIEYEKLLAKMKEIEEDKNFTVESQAKALGLVVSNEMPEIQLENENNFDIHIDGFLQTLHYPDELEKILKQIELNARSIINVTGSNMLYLVLGVLEWREAANPEVKVKSPLINIPVVLKRTVFNRSTNTYEFTLAYSGEVIDTNESLSQKLFNDFKVKLPTLTEEVSFNAYIQEVKKLCENREGWNVKAEVSLDFLQFGKVLMYKDLENQKRLKNRLDHHPILRDIFLGKKNQDEVYSLSDYEIDKEPLANKIPLVMDADSSQYSAMIDVFKGKNVVIEGPPGTGKSQIIANLIAALIYEGKKVLFVSEKLVALEVVYERLEQIGLGDFCLELHSHKTDKLAFLKNINQRVTGTYAYPEEYNEIRRNLESSKRALNGYLEILHTVYGENRKSLFETIWLRERYLKGADYFIFKIKNALRLKSDDLRYCEEYLKEYGLHYADYNVRDSFWNGFEVNTLSFSQIDRFLFRVQTLKTPYHELSEELKHRQIALSDEPKEIETLKSFLETFIYDEPYYFPYEDKATFQHLEATLQKYLAQLLGSVERSEIDLLETADILEMAQTSSEILTQLSQFEGELKPEVARFEKFIAESQKSFEEFEELEQKNGKNLHLPMVHHHDTSEVYKVVDTVMNKRDSWLRFILPSYKRAKGKFQAMLKETLPQKSEEWTFLLRELNLYALNRENQLNLRLVLVEKVPMFIEKIEGVGRKIKKTLDAFERIEKSSIASEFKVLLYQSSDAQKQFAPLLQKYRQVEAIEKELEPFGKVTAMFYGEASLKYDAMIAKLNRVQEQRESLPSWITYHTLLNKLNKLGLREMMQRVQTQELPVEHMVKTFYYNYYNSLLEDAFLEFPSLETFNRIKQERLVEKFRELDEKILLSNRELIAHKLSQKELPPSEGKGRVSTFTNLKLLQHEVGKKTRHVPIRQLLKRAGDAIEVLKPCYMMSPLSVAQYIPNNKLSFDVLLIDEASQLKPEEGLGAISRAKQVVVVGDPKQLPPTAFFDVVEEEIAYEEKTVLDDSESILDSFMELYSPIRRLKWHYRSKHESLIDFSNKHFYDNELTIFPSPSNEVSEALGVKYTYVEDGFYKGGEKYRVNLREAQKVVEILKEHMESSPEKSIGVGTLNGTQRELIQELVDSAEKEFEYVAKFIECWSESHEAFFVKNLESLQGDERDVIVISTTYGKEEGSDKVYQRFGPINQESGWRRLNVLITRSKQKMHVVTSMKSSDLRVSNNTSRGLKALKEFLNYIERGYQATQKEIDEVSEFSSIFAEVLYGLLKEKGIEVVPNVGVSGYYIDLAVVSKKDGRYILAIECDGENFYHAKSSSDRYRLKSSALKRLGWNHYHIWSVEWYKNRSLEMERLLRVIEEVDC
jgi:hypothetical protein